MEFNKLTLTWFSYMVAFSLIAQTNEKIRLNPGKQHINTNSYKEIVLPESQYLNDSSELIMLTKDYLELNKQYELCDEQVNLYRSKIEDSQKKNESLQYQITELRQISLNFEEYQSTIAYKKRQVKNRGILNWILGGITVGLATYITLK